MVEWLRLVVTTMTRLDPGILPLSADLTPFFPHGLGILADFIPSQKGSNGYHGLYAL